MSGAEAQVVVSLKRHLEKTGASRVLVDADPAYRLLRRDLEPMARIDIQGARPDMVCSIEHTDGVLVKGFEVKASSRDWVIGIGQARRYRAGVHQAYLALPGRPDAIERETRSQRDGVGLLVLDRGAWHEVVPAADPTPLPWSVGAITAALEGVPVARQLQLNHPLNYLMVAYCAATVGPERVMEALASEWTGLGQPSTRRAAVTGAMTLHLVDRELRPTEEGRAVAELMVGVGFTPQQRPTKKQRLLEVAPPLAAIARFVFLRQPAVKLVLRSLAEEGRGVPLPRLARRALQLDPHLGGALFLSDPSSELLPGSGGEAYNPSTVFKFKQNLWHAGFLEVGAHPTAGKHATAFRPDQDVWALRATR